MSSDHFFVKDSYSLSQLKDRNVKFKPIDAEFSRLYNEQVVYDLLNTMRQDPSADPLELLLDNQIRFRGLNTQNSNTIAVVGTDYNFVPHTVMLGAVEAAFNANGLDMLPFSQKADKSGRIHTFMYVQNKEYMINNEPYFYGFELKDSYGGLTPVVGSLFTFRKACMNGLKIGQASVSSFKFRHNNQLNVTDVFLNLDSMIEESQIGISRIEKLPEIKVKIDSTLLQNLEKLYGNRTTSNIIELYDMVYAVEMGENAYALMNAATHYASHEIGSFTGQEKVNTVNNKLFVGGDIFKLLNVNFN